MYLDSDAICVAREALLASSDYNNDPNCSKIVAEALYHLCGGRDNGLLIVKLSNHWWLLDERGYIWDPTWDRFPEKDYDRGLPEIVPEEPSEDAKEMMDRIEFELFGFQDVALD
jgi:hypothetical protein